MSTSAALLPLLPLAVAAPAAGLYAYTRLHAAHAPAATRSLSGLRGVAPLTPKGVQKSARQLRDIGRNPKPEDCGVLLGKLGNTEMRAGWRSTVLAIMGPGAGKTTALAVNAMHDAPGPVLATSNKPDLWMATEADWTFDPQRIVRAAQRFWVDLLAYVDNAEEGHRLASRFVETVEGEGNKDPFWAKSATLLLQTLFVAAHYGPKTISVVWEWVNEPGTPEPGEILKEAGLPALAQAYAGIADGVPVTRGGIYMNAITACACLADDRITAWVTPPRGRALPAFDPMAFVQSYDRMHLLSKDGGGSAAPLVGALTDEIFRCATLVAEQNGGRLDPPLVAILDEAANVCKIDLPLQYSHFGSRGIVPITILQSWAQGALTWGHAGMKTLWGNSTVKLVGAGAGDDASFGGDVSRLLGEHDVPTVSHGSGRGGSSQNRGTRRERKMSGGDMREIPELRAVLLANGCKAAWIKLLPWFLSDRREEIRYAIEKARAGITARSRAA